MVVQLFIIIISLCIMFALLIHQPYGIDRVYTAL